MSFSRGNAPAAAALLALVGAVLPATPAFAHATERAFVLLLPTAYYIAGGTLAVAASFGLLLLWPGAIGPWIAHARLKLCLAPAVAETATSAISFLLLVMLVLAGFVGTRDPLANPLPLTVWTLWWVGLTIAQALFGNLWALLNPWIAPHRLLTRLTGGRRLLAYPAWLGYWPATLGFLAFAWFELIDPAPDDPARLAKAVIAYSVITLAGMRLFGEQAWLTKGECFSVFFAFVAQLSLLRLENDGRRRLLLACPGATFVKRDPLPLSGVCFVLLTLAAVSFDGLSKTFWWLDLGGVNPLEFPGRTAVMARNSLGLVAMWAALAMAYGAGIALGLRLAGVRGKIDHALGVFVLSILPISVGYHFAHYLTTFLVNGQYALGAFADPFARGWDLLGMADRHITVSFLSNYDAVSIIWKIQVAGVVLGHIVAVSLAHAIAFAAFGSARAALTSQLPLAVLMIGYTLFGLWLLAAPTAG
jgi:hypothetical protein